MHLVAWEPLAIFLDLLPTCYHTEERDFSWGMRPKHDATLVEPGSKCRQVLLEAKNMAGGMYFLQSLRSEKQQVPPGMWCVSFSLGLVGSSLDFG